MEDFPEHAVAAKGVGLSMGGKKALLWILVLVALLIGVLWGASWLP
jgi:hypothetical protein